MLSDETDLLTLVMLVNGDSTKACVFIVIG